MPLSTRTRILLVGVAPELQPALRGILDRRGLKIEGVRADIASACKEIQSNPGSSHFLIAQLPPANLATLSATFPGQPILALLPTNATVAEVVAAQRAGATQVSGLPLVAEDILGAIENVEKLLPPEQHDPKIFAVCGVSGGCGATTLALNLSWELSRREGTGRQCLLIELTRQMGSLAAYLNIEPARTTQDLFAASSLMNLASVRQAKVQVTPRFDVLVGPYRDITPSQFQQRQVTQLVELCKRIAPLVVLDVPCTFDDLQFETLALADTVILVGSQTVASIRTMKLLRETLEREEGLRDIRPVINRYEPSLPGFSADSLADFLGVAQVATVANDFPAVMSSVSHGKPLGMAVPHSPVVSDLAALVRGLIGGYTPLPPTRPGGSLARKTKQLPRVVRVLHVEDDRVQHQAMRLHLASIKEMLFQLTPAISETEAMNTFRQQPFDLVILDYHLAQGNGLSCLQQLRAIDPMVPVVVISAIEDPEVAAELLNAGADDFVSKENLSSKALGRTLASALARADAIRQRFGENLADTHSSYGPPVMPEERELLKHLRQLQEAAQTHGYSAGQIQRLVEIVCAELDKTPGRQPTPRKGLLALFMRLFGGHTE